MEFRLLGAALIGIGAMWVVLRFGGGPALRRTVASEEPASGSLRTWDALLSSMLAGLVAGRLAAMIGAGTNPVTAPADILIVRGGVDTIVAALAAIATFAALGRADLWRLADAAAPAAVAGLAGWHGGCVVRNTCLGTPSDLPWAIAQEGSTITRHPVEVYAALLLVAAVVLLAVLRRRESLGTGAVGASALGLAALVRLVTEPMRPGLGSDPTPGYALGVVAGVVLLAWRYRTGRGGSGR